MRLTESNIIRVLQKKQHRTGQELLDLGLPLQFVAEGQFREVYHIVGTSIVVKIPRVRGCSHRTHKKNVAHATTEYRAWRRIMSRGYTEIRPYMPEILYHNKATGLVLMRQYRPVPRLKKNRETLSRLGRSISRIVAETRFPDVHAGNAGIDEDGNIRLIDLGLFELAP